MSEHDSGAVLSRSDKFIKATIEQTMGEVLDFGKLNGMGGAAQLEQYIRSVKSKFSNLQTLYRDKLILKDEVKEQK